MDPFKFPDDIRFLIVDWIPVIVSPSIPVVGTAGRPFNCLCVSPSGALSGFELARARHDGMPCSLSEFKRNVLEETSAGPMRDRLMRSLDLWAASRAAP